jgi:alpha-L-rhamnosidase
VRKIKISNVKGTANSFGEITGHDQTTISNILVADVDVQLKSTEFKVGKVNNLSFKNVKVNGKKWQNDKK